MRHIKSLNKLRVIILMSDSDEFSEFGELIGNCQKIEEHVNKSLDILYNMNDPINKILHRLHADAMNGKNTFFDSILEAIDSLK